MRQYNRRQCLDTLNLIKEIHGECRKLARVGNFEEIAGLFGDCQQGAISVGETIDSLEREETRTVHFLEEYCEILYELNEDLNVEKARELQSKFEMLDTEIEKVEKTFQKEITTQYEVVFLPYKASMWDSLESVWKETCEDENCETFVIPIPYFDKNPDGSFREAHYEMDLFPKNVPVLGYKSYDFENRHPDRIYIHNPYDEANYVTSVHPDFYSDKLKKYTDELIYIPYFILDEPDLDNEDALEGMSHFVTVPAVVNADKVIVQSESMKEAYVRIMTKYAGEKTRPYWEKKIVGSGSPKVERVQNLSEDDYTIPEEWKKYVEGKEGKNKKIILYNTSITAILKHEQKMIDKIKNVLQLFWDCRDDITLLWRPHPLTEATLLSMRPELWKQYMQIVEKYKSENWGIYDDTPDMDRAIAISDAYYGDPSSLVWLYKMTGKPIMIQNCEV